MPTVMSCGVETLEVKLEAPLKSAVKECAPWLMEGMVKTASPFAEIGCVETGLPLSRRVTVPAGAPLVVEAT